MKGGALEVPRTRHCAPNLCRAQLPIDQWLTRCEQRGGYRKDLVIPVISTSLELYQNCDRERGGGTRSTQRRESEIGPAQGRTFVRRVILNTGKRFAGARLSWLVDLTEIIGLHLGIESLHAHSEDFRSYLLVTAYRPQDACNMSLLHIGHRNGTPRLNTCTPGDW